MRVAAFTSLVRGLTGVVLLASLALAQEPPAAPAPAAEVARIGETPLAEWLAKWRAQTPDERAKMEGDIPTGPAEGPNRAAFLALADHLTAPDVEERLLACRLLRYDTEDGAQLMPRLAVAVKDGDARVRCAAASALANVAWMEEQHGPSFTLAIDELIAQVKGSDRELRRDALWVLQGSGRVEPRVTDICTAVMKESDAELRRIAVRGLGTAVGKYDDARPPLHEALNDSDATVRLNAASALAGQGENTDEIAGVLEGLTTDPTETVRWEAINSLASLGFERASETLPLLLAALNDESPNVRAAAAGAIGNLGSSDNVDAPEAAPRLVELTRDENATVRGAAAWALGHVGATAEVAVPALASLIEDPNQEARDYALASLEQAGGEVALALPQLIAALKNPDATVRTSVAKLIGLGGERSKQATDALIERLADPSVNVRVWSAYALRQIGAPAVAAVPRLAKSLGEDPEPKMRVEAARALAAFGPLAGAAADALVAACKDPDVDVRLWSLFALGELQVRSDAAIATLKEAAASNDERVVAEANKALEKLGEAHDAKAVENAPGAPPDLPALSAPIHYEGFALVLVDASAAAVVAFFDESHEASRSGGRDGVKYRYRYLAKGQTEATAGEGEACSIMIRNTDSAFGVEDVAASHSYVDAGPLRVGWSHRSRGSAFVYWKPEKLTVTLASALEFETLDLHRFLR